MTIFAEIERTTPGVPRIDRENRKVRQILAAAERLFLEKNYGAVTMDALAREADVSKRTLYDHFSSKEILFAALIRELNGEVAGLAFDPDGEIDDVTAVLREIAQSYTKIFVSSRAFALHRSVIAEASRFPELGRAVADSGPLYVKAKVARFLDAANRRKLLRVPDAELAATQFLALIRGDLPMNAMLALGEPTRGEIERQIDGALQLFLAGYGPKPAAARGGKR